MADATSEELVKVWAYSPGRYPILVLELSTGDLITVYHETGYDLERSKRVTEEWLSDNAIGRHSFVEITPPDEVPANGLAEYARDRTAQEK